MSFVAIAAALALVAPTTWSTRSQDTPGAVRLVRDVELELAVRDGARSLEAALDQLERAREADWVERRAALEALIRGLQSDPGAERPPIPAAVRAAALDPHPNVRAAALVAVGLCPAWAAALLEDRDRARTLARDLLPETRGALAAAHVAGLEGGLDPVAALEVLSTLVEDSDADVRRVARHGVVAALGAGGSEAAADLLATLIADLWNAGEHHRALDLVDALETIGPGVEVLERFAAGLDGELLAVARALSMVAGGAADPLEVATDWPRRFGDRARLEPLLWRAVHAGGVADPWLEVAIERGDGDLARAVAYALGPEPLADLAPSLPGQDALPLLEALGETASTWDAARAEALLISEAPASAVVDALGRAVLADDPGASAALAAALAGLPASARERALRLLSPSAIAAHSPAIFAAWEEAGRPLSWIDRLPRLEPASAFRLALLEFGADRGLRTRVAAPLGAFEGDAVVIELLTGWLDEELGDVELGEPGSGQAAEALAAALLRSGGASSAAVVSGAVARAAGPAPEVAAALARRLGQLEAGRAFLSAVLAREPGAPGPWPASVVDESLIAIVAAGVPPSGSLERLVERLTSMPDESQARAFSALRARGAQVSSAAVASLAHDVSLRLTLRLRAVDALAAIGPRAAEDLIEVFRIERDFELRSACVRGLGEIGGDVGAAGLRRLRAELNGDRAREGFVEPAVEEGRDLLDQELRIELAGLGEPVLDDIGGFLMRVVDDAPRAVAARFAREPSAAVEFRWRVEIAGALALAREGRLGDALAASGPWWRSDGRLTLLLARAADGDDRARRDLARAALVALSGEASPGATSADRARLVAFELELALQDWAAVETRAAQLLRARALGQLSERAWQAALGGPHPAAGRDPLAWLKALRHQARALAELERGDVGAAREAAERAAPSAGRSLAAAELQATIEDRLDG